MVYEGMVIQIFRMGVRIINWIGELSLKGIEKNKFDVRRLWA